MTAAAVEQPGPRPDPDAQPAVVDDEPRPDQYPPEKSDEVVQEASEESFPASDPPGWNSTTIT